MIISKQQEFSDAQSLTASFVLSTNVVDLGATGTPLGAPTALTRDIGPGEAIPVMVQVSTAFAGVGSFSVEVQTGDTASLSGATTVVKTEPVTATTLVAGYQIPIAVLPNKLTGRYLGLKYVLTTTSLTGAVDAAIVHGLQTNKAAGRA